MLPVLNTGQWTTPDLLWLENLLCSRPLPMQDSSPDGLWLPLVSCMGRGGLVTIDKFFFNSNSSIQYPSLIHCLLVSQSPLWVQVCLKVQHLFSHNYLLSSYSGHAEYLGCLLPLWPYTTVSTFTCLEFLHTIGSRNQYHFLCCWAESWSGKSCGFMVLFLRGSDLNVWLSFH